MKIVITTPIAGVTKVAAEGSDCVRKAGAYPDASVVTDDYRFWFLGRPQVIWGSFGGWGSGAPDRLFLAVLVDGEYKVFERSAYEPALDPETVARELRAPGVFAVKLRGGDYPAVRTFQVSTAWEGVEALVRAIGQPAPAELSEADLAAIRRLVCP